MPRNPDGSNTLSTIGDMIEEGYEISAHCGGTGCHHWSRLDLTVLAKRLGRDHSARAEALTPYFRCSKCGSKDVSYTLSPPVTPSR